MQFGLSVRPSALSAGQVSDGLLVGRALVAYCVGLVSVRVNHDRSGGADVAGVGTFCFGVSVVVFIAVGSSVAVDVVLVLSLVVGVGDVVDVVLWRSLLMLSCCCSC